MIWLIEKLTGKAALYACAALLAVISSLSFALWWVRSDYRDEVAAHATTKATLTQAVSANTAWAATTKELETKLERANRENLRVSEEGRAAVAAANRRAKAAQTELAAFHEVFANKTASCREALENMEESCPELRDY